MFISLLCLKHHSKMVFLREKKNHLNMVRCMLKGRSVPKEFLKIYHCLLCLFADQVSNKMNWRHDTGGSMEYAQA